MKANRTEMERQNANLIFEAIAHSLLHAINDIFNIGGYHLCRVCAIYISFFIDCMHSILKLIHANRFYI